MTGSPTSGKKTLELRQTWFLGAMVIAVVCMFAFVILPYVDPPQEKKLSGQQAPDFDLELLSGGGLGDRIRLSDLRGKTVVLDFWASWCQPCRAQSAFLAEAAASFPPDVYVLGIATSDQRDAAEAFVKSKPSSYANAFDEGGAVGLEFAVKNLPTIVVIDEGGQIRAFREEVLSTKNLIALVHSIKG